MVLNKQGSKTIESDIFNAYAKSFTAFQKVCSLEHLDGQWLGPIVDHMCAMLVQYAELADIEAKQDPHLKK